jgi:hypothetical protein
VFARDAHAMAGTGDEPNLVGHVWSFLRCRAYGAGAMLNVVQPPAAGCSDYVPASGRCRFAGAPCVPPRRASAGRRLNR